jgi:hypothetical protein
MWRIQILGRIVTLVNWKAPESHRAALPRRNRETLAVNRGRAWCKQNRASPSWVAPAASPSAPGIKVAAQDARPPASRLGLVARRILPLRRRIEVGTCPSGASGVSLFPATSSPALDAWPQFSNINKRTWHKLAPWRAKIWKIAKIWKRTFVPAHLFFFAI